MNYNGIILDLIVLAVAGAYLYWRKFDFKQLNFSVNRYTLPLTLAMIFTAGAVANIYEIIHYNLFPQHIMALRISAKWLKKHINIHGQIIPVAFHHHYLYFHF
ncbi:MULTISPECIES: hypothetical protein [unclassified Acinetobacter]|uniref:hypothetical protein n=1 Tax=unclassified Acinetobacter TaxID=196816 RepID=UPI0035B7E3DF